MATYYQILGISINATHDEIKKAYRRQAMLHHPDRNHGSEAASRFRQVNEAYKVLINEVSRKLYDYKIREVRDIKKDYRKYGTSVRNPSYSAEKGSATQTNPKPNGMDSEKMEVDKKDRYLFYSLVGLMSCFLLFSIYNLLFDTEKTGNSIQNILLGTAFLLIFIRGWRVLINGKS